MKNSIKLILDADLVLESISEDSVTKVLVSELATIGEQQKITKKEKIKILQSFAEILAHAPFVEFSEQYVRSVCKSFSRLLVDNSISKKVKNDLMNYLFERNYSAVERIISYNPFALQNLAKEYRTNELISIAICKNAFAIQFVDNPTDEIIEKAVCKNPFAIQFIDNPTDEIIRKAIRKNAFAIQFIDNPTDKMCKLASIVNPDSKKFFLK